MPIRVRLGGGVVGSVLVPTPGSVHSTVIELRLRLRLGGGGVVGSVLVAMPGSVHSTFIELQFLIIPRHHIHIAPRPLLFRHYKLFECDMPSMIAEADRNEAFLELQVHSLRLGSVLVSGTRMCFTYGYPYAYASWCQP